MRILIRRVRGLISLRRRNACPEVRRNIACPARPNIGNGGINTIDGAVDLGAVAIKMIASAKRNPRLGQSQLERAVHARL